MPILLFVFGLVMGSFLNVLIIRLPEKESILGYSKCSKCKKRILWQENIPVLSFLILKGRCHDCKSKISWQYPLVELLTGFLFLISFFAYGEKPVFLVYTLFLIGILTAIAFIDLKHFIIPDSLISSGFIVSFLFILFAPGSLFLISRFYGLLFFAGIFLSIFLASGGRWIGFGDIKLAALLGFVFGLESSIAIFYLAFLAGFIIAIILLVLKKADLKTQIPLGSLMSAAGIFFLLSRFNLLELINADLILKIWSR